MSLYFNASIWHVTRGIHRSPALSLTAARVAELLPSSYPITVLTIITDEVKALPG